jgi:hypothetical protein
VKTSQLADPTKGKIQQIFAPLNWILGMMLCVPGDKFSYIAQL